MTAIASDLSDNSGHNSSDKPSHVCVEAFVEKRKGGGRQLWLSLIHVCVPSTANKAQTPASHVPKALRRAWPSFLWWVWCTCVRLDGVTGGLSQEQVECQPARTVSSTCVNPFSCFPNNAQPTTQTHKARPHPSCLDHASIVCPTSCATP